VAKQSSDMRSGDQVNYTERHQQYACGAE